MKKEPILVSACLLGERCRYDAKIARSEAVSALSDHYELVPFCPEVAGGLSIPRPPAELVQGRAQLKDGTDVHDAYAKGAFLGVSLAKKRGIRQAVLKKKSPACGYGDIYDGTFSRTLTKGNGVFTTALLADGLTIYTEDMVEAGALERR